MQLRYIQPFSQYEPGDLVEVPDGAAYDPFYLEPAPVDAFAPDPVPVPDPEPAAPAAQFPQPAPKEM